MRRSRFPEFRCRSPEFAPIGVIRGPKSGGSNTNGNVDMTNYFTDASIAHRYASSRRPYHAAVADQIRALFDPHALTTVGLALDVGCGAGMSTVALTSIADQVIGLDASPAMLRYAATHERVEYRLGSAEYLPSEDGSVDLITAGSAFHWFDQPLFLSEVARVLRPGGYLAIYTDWFIGMVTNPEFARWYAEVHSLRHPPPPRGKMFPDAADTTVFGLALIGRSDFSHVQDYSIEALVEYLTTQSNIGVIVQSGGKDIVALAAQIRAEVAPYFGQETEHFKFGGSVVCYRTHEALHDASNP